jgi:hypothetical protein
MLNRDMGFRKVRLEENSTLYHSIPISLAEHSNIKFRNLQDSSDLGSAGEDAALTYCFLHGIDIPFL